MAMYNIHFSLKSLSRADYRKKIHISKGKEPLDMLVCAFEGKVSARRHVDADIL